MSDTVVLRELIRRKYNIDKGLFAFILYGNVPKAPPFPPINETPRWYIYVENRVVCQYCT